MALSARLQLMARSSHLYQATAAAARCYSDVSTWIIVSCSIYNIFSCDTLKYQ